MASLTVYPDANPETTSVDGWVGRNGVDETLATIRAAAGTFSGDSDTDAYLYMAASATTNQYADLRRFILLFNTAALGAGAVVTGATLSIWCLSKANGLGSPDVHAVASNPAINTQTSSVGDFASVGATSFGSVAYASITTGAYTDITLNGSGLAAIDPVGITKLGLRNSWDQSGTFGGVWGSGLTAFFQIECAENASGQAHAPKLVITYDPATVPLTVSLTEPILGESRF